MDNSLFSLQSCIWHFTLYILVNSKLYHAVRQITSRGVESKRIGEDSDLVGLHTDLRELNKIKSHPIQQALVGRKILSN